MQWVRVRVRVMHNCDAPAPNTQVCCTHANPNPPRHYSRVGLLPVRGLCLALEQNLDGGLRVGQL